MIAEHDSIGVDHRDDEEVIGTPQVRREQNLIDKCLKGEVGGGFAGMSAGQEDDCLSLGVWGCLLGADGEKGNGQSSKTHSDLLRVDQCVRFQCPEVAAQTGVGVGGQRCYAHFLPCQLKLKLKKEAFPLSIEHITHILTFLGPWTEPSLHIGFHPVHVQRVPLFEFVYSEEESLGLAAGHREVVPLSQAASVGVLPHEKPEICLPCFDSPQQIATLKVAVELHLSPVLHSPRPHTLTHCSQEEGGILGDVPPICYPAPHFLQSPALLLLNELNWHLSVVPQRHGHHYTFAVALFVIHRFLKFLLGLLRMATSQGGVAISQGGVATSEEGVLERITDYVSVFIFWGQHTVPLVISL